jgi:hypothetical protein
MFATLCQQFAPRLLAQVLQQIQLLVELLGVPSNSTGVIRHKRLSIWKPQLRTNWV